jgi:hypothetical protein
MGSPFVIVSQSLTQLHGKEFKFAYGPRWAYLVFTNFLTRITTSIPDWCTRFGVYLTEYLFKSYCNTNTSPCFV